MAAGARINVLLPDGRAIVLSKDVGDKVGCVVFDEDGSLRDLTSDTLSVAAKLETTAKTLTFAAQANQTTTGKGLATLTIPAAQIDAAGTLYADLKVQVTGDEAVIVARVQFTVEDSSAD